MEPWLSAHIDNRKKTTKYLPTCRYNMENFSLLAPEICCRVLVPLHGTLVMGVSQTLRRWTEAATYIRQGGHHVRHWPTF